MRLNSPPVGRTVHIWRIDLTDVRWDDGEDTLSTDELQSGYRRRDIVLRRRYWRCRSAVRLLLASYSQRSAQQLRFTYGKFGKPELVGVPWHFNVSHSSDTALLAVASLSVGVDIEDLDHVRIDIEEVAELICHPCEAQATRAMSCDERRAFLIRLWVRKESYLKAVGFGVRFGLRDVCVMRASPSQVHDDSTAHGLTIFHVSDIEATQRCVASFCVPFANAEVVLRQATISDLLVPRLQRT